MLYVIRSPLFRRCGSKNVIVSNAISTPPLSVDNFALNSISLNFCLFNTGENAAPVPFPPVNAIETIDSNPISCGSITTLSIEPATTG